MGGDFVFRNQSSNFIEQLKIDNKGQTKIIGIFLTPNEFPTNGLIIISEKYIQKFNPIYGNQTAYLPFPSPIILADYNRQSIEGSMIFIVTEDMNSYFINSENLSKYRTVNILKKNNLRIKNTLKLITKKEEKETEKETTK